MKLYTTFIILTLSFSNAFSQKGPKTWTEFYSYNSVKQILEAEKYIVALTQNGLFLYNRESLELSEITKSKDLSTVGLTNMAYDQNLRSIIVGYEDGCIDIINMETYNIINETTIARKNIYGSKSINEIITHKDTAYIATNFGLITYNLISNEFASTTVFGNSGEYIPINAVSIDSASNTIYAASSNKIYYTQLNENLSDISLWNTISNIPKNNEEIIDLVYFNNSIYYAVKNSNIQINDSIFRISNVIASPFKQQISSIKELKVSNNNLCVIGNRDIRIYDTNETLIVSIDSSYKLKQEIFTDFINCKDNTNWLSDAQHGIANTQTFTPIYPKGPIRNTISDIYFRNGDLHVVYGISSAFQTGMYQVLHNNIWYGHVNWQVRNSQCVYPLPNSDTYYYGTIGWGLVECSKSWNYDSIYNSSNSLIQNIYNDNSTYEYISDITSDRNNNIWILNKGVNNPILVKTKENAWYSYNIPGFPEAAWVEKIHVDKNGFKWVVGESNVLVFDENKTFENTSDDNFTIMPLIDTEGTIAEKTTCIAEDIDGEMWIGTTQGIAVHSQSSRVFIDRKNIKRLKIEIDGEVGYLLSSEKITAIAVDGGNRKWIGTQNSGIFLVSPDGTEQLLNFTVSNSPLPSNAILAISINHENGEVFIVTEKGLISYMSDASLGVKTMENIIVFPNPVRPEYEGDIYIKGTTSNAIIKITDIAGNLVYQTIANGGTGVWNGKNVMGERAATGVYIIYISDEEGKETSISKIAFIN